jgi:hypothetical protein
MTSGKNSGQPIRPPSWATAISESDAAQRQVTLAQRSLDRATSELRSLRAWSSQMARLEVARGLTEGDDGGVLNLLLAAAHSEAGVAQRAGRAALDRLQAALGLVSIPDRDELLRLGLDQLTEFELRGTAAAGVAVYRVVRPGWLLDGVIVSRPVVELVLEAGRE